jgi:hypothetical protein
MLSDIYLQKSNYGLLSVLVISMTKFLPLINACFGSKALILNVCFELINHMEKELF